jgi:hypothetical protein
MNSLTVSQGERFFDYIGNALAEFSTADELWFLQRPGIHDIFDLASFFVLLTILILDAGMSRIDTMIMTAFQNFYQLFIGGEQKLDATSNWLNDHEGLIMKFGKKIVPSVLKVSHQDSSMYNASIVIACILLVWNGG